MADVFTKKKRSEIMSKIRSKNTVIERTLRKELWSRGIRYRLYDKKLPGKPDIVIKKSKLVIFIDGCFWHRCPKCFKKPKSNTKYWDSKIKYNVTKDKRVNRLIKKEGWEVIRIWEHQIRDSIDKCVQKIIVRL